MATKTTGGSMYSGLLQTNQELAKAQEVESNALSIGLEQGVKPLQGYLMGIANEKKQREIPFIRKTDEHIAIWEGAKLTKAQANDISGIQTICWLEDFEAVFQKLSTQCDTFYFNTNEHYRQSVETQTREDRFIKWCKKQYPAHSNAKSNPILQKLRSIKDDEEIKQLQTA